MEVKVVELNPMKVASCRFVGPDPEDRAFEGLRQWAGKHGLPAETTHPRLFGFNNPNPSGPNSTYGYEVWMELEKEGREGDGVTIKNIPGGTYARAKVPVSTGEGIADAWRAFRPELIEPGYVVDRSRTCLEEHVVDMARYPKFEDDPNFAIYLMTPVKKA